MKKIIVVQTAFLGDLLLSIPLLRQLKSFYPESEVTLVCKKGLGEIFARLKLCDKLVEVDKSNGDNFKQNAQSLFKEKYDLLLCPHESPRSGMLAKKIHAKTKAGFSNWWNFLVFNKRIKRNMGLPDALRQLSLLGTLNAEVAKGIENYLQNKSDYKIPDTQAMGLKRRILSHPDTPKINQKFRIIPRSIFVAPGSVWNTKRWTEEGFRELIQRLSKENPVVMIGSS
jgi:heptosyltransferase-2